MPDDNQLARVPDQEAALIQRVDPQVLSTAEPTVDALLIARARLNSDEDLQGLFDQAFQEDNDDEWLVTQLTEGLCAKVEIEFDAREAREACQYLVDEYRQLGEGIHMVNSDTGKVAMTLTENDLWQPAAVPRESGGMVEPLQQMRPDVAAFLTTWTFDRAHEQEVVAKLAARGHQTALLREDGDPRLLVATREGRSHIAQSLAQFRPEDLLRALGGTSAAFLQHFELTTEEPEEADIRGTVNSRTVMGIHDQTTVNIHHNRPAVMRGALTQGWVREVCRQLVRHSAAHYRNTEGPPLPFVRAASITKETLQEAHFWIAPPEVIMWMRRADPTKAVLPVDQINYILGFTKQKVGSLTVPQQFALGNREWFGRWETETALDFAMCVDWDAVTVVLLKGVTHQGSVVL